MDSINLINTLKNFTNDEREFILSFYRKCKICSKTKEAIDFFNKRTECKECFSHCNKIRYQSSKLKIKNI